MLTALLAAWALPAPGAAQTSAETVQAAFLPKFARYVAWPDGRQPAPDQSFVLCVIGRDPFGPLIDQAAATEVIDGRSVLVRRLANAQGAQACHIAFVRGGTPDETGRILLALRGHAILTVTDSRIGPERGMIHFVISGGRMRFFIDEAAASAHGLNVSSRLLALALGVRQRR